MTTYKVTINSADKAEKYFKNLMTAVDAKESLKKKRKDGYLYHVFSMIPDGDDWYKLE